MREAGGKGRAGRVGGLEDRSVGRVESGVGGGGSKRDEGVYQGWCGVVVGVKVWGGVVGLWGVRGGVGERGGEG